MVLWEDQVIQYVIEQHEQMIELIINKDKEELKKLTEKHLGQQYEEEKILMEKYDEYFEKNIDEKDNEISFLKRDFLKNMR